jgi:2-C-methyl-D-erythritol 4-phosphate cytidylyltransferase
MLGTEGNERQGARAVIAAAGRSQRMGDIDKLWAPVRGPDKRTRPLLAYTLAAFQDCPAVGRMVLVTAQGVLGRARELIESESFDKVRAVVAGGARRQDSVRAGLEALGRCGWVIVHDGARPLVTPDLIEHGLLEARATGASSCALPVPDTVKEGDDTDHVARTLERSRLWLGQTPQTFRYDLLVEAHREAKGDVDVTDDAVLVEALGVRVRLYRGSPRNLKVTTPEDLAIAEALLAHS